MISTNGHVPPDEPHVEEAAPVAVNLPDDPAALRRLYVESGGNPNTQAVQKAELQARNKGRAEVRRRREEASTARGRVRTGVAQGVTAAVEIVAIGFTIVIILGGMTIGTVFVLGADIDAVKVGIEIITTSNALLYAVAIVLFLIVVSFIYEVIAVQSGAVAPERVFSLRHLGRWVKYFFGWGEQWQEWHRTSPPLAKVAGNAVRWLMWTIVLFGLLGRLKVSMADSTVPWHQWLVEVITESTAQEMGGYVGAVVMTVGLLLSIRFIVYFIHQVFNRVTGGIDATSFFDDFSPEQVIEYEVIIFWQNEVLRQQQKQKLLAAKNTPEETT